MKGIVFIALLATAVTALQPLRGYNQIGNCRSSKFDCAPFGCCVIGTYLRLIEMNCVIHSDLLLCNIQRLVRIDTGKRIDICLCSFYAEFRSML